MTARQVAAARNDAKVVGEQIDSALMHLDAAQAPFADLLDVLDEIEFEFEDAERFAALVQEATNKLRQARGLLSALPGAGLSVVGGGS